MENLGLTHKDRHLKELDSNYFKVDERSIDDFINFAAKFARYINYYNTENNLDGTAMSFFAKDPTILLIHISSFKIKHIEKKLEHIISEIYNDKINIISALNFLYQLIEQIEDWNIATARDLNEFNKEIKKLITSKFTKSLSKIIAFEDSLIIKGLIKPKTKVFNFLSKKEWETNYVSQKEFVYKSESGNSLAHEISNYIYQIFYPLSDSIQLLIDSSKNYLQTIRNAGSTKPHIALYITFIELFKFAQKDINNFTQRHLNYYYKEILKFNKISETPDQVHLTFNLQDGTDLYKLPKGTELLAGQDIDGKNIIYELNEELIISKAYIDNIKTIINEVGATENTNKKFENVVLNHDINKDIYEEEKKPDSYDLGFAIATSFLKLTEGDREIKFTLQIQRHSFDNFIELYKNEVLDDKNIDIYDINDFVKDLFSFTYTTLVNENQEWFTLPKKNIKTKFQKNIDGNPINKLDVTVFVDTLFPPIDTCISEEYPEAFDRQLPICKFFIDYEKIYFYNYYKLLVIDRIYISTTVLGIKDLKIQNDYGSLDPSIPFEPFTAVPTIGSTFYLGHETIFSRKLDDLQIVLEWNDVPLLESGFPEYYDGYKYIDSNYVFKAKVSALKDRKWLPENNKQVISLFQDIEDEEGTPVDNFRIIEDIDLQKINSQFKGSPLINDNEFYSRVSRNGFIKFEFIYPPTGFGQKEYPEIIKQQALHSIKSKSIPESINEPWTPTLRSISINYESSVTLDFGNQEPKNKAFLYHIYPFGNKLVSEPVGNNINLLPNYKKGAEIYLAITNFNIEETLTLYFHIDKFAKDSFEHTNTKIEWSFLQKETWLNIRQNQIIKDTTNNITNSGIITFTFDDLDKEFFNDYTLLNSRKLPKGFFYLKLYSSKGEEFVNKISTIKCHGGTATFVNNNNSSEHLQEPLPTNTITNFLDEHPSIKEINQDFESFGGKPEESLFDFQVRVSERLRHKDRAINKWDYEHIILQKFPNISKVVCLNNTNINLHKKPGSVLLVTIPNITKTIDKKVLQPKNPEAKLRKIKKSISKRISPFVNIDVCNPIYEQVQVKFEVKFFDELNVRYYLQKVNEDLKEFLNPWVYDGDIQLTRTEKIYSIHLVYFLEKLDYVDYVTNLSAYHIVDNSIINLDVAHDNNAVLIPTTKISIFVSASEHIITVIGGEDMQDAIGTMIIGKDFTAEDITRKKITKGIENTQIEIDLEIHGRKRTEEIEDEYELFLT